MELKNVQITINYTAITLEIYFHELKKLGYVDKYSNMSNKQRQNWFI